MECCSEEDHVSVDSEIATQITRMTPEFRTSEDFHLPLPGYHANTARAYSVSKLTRLNS